ncbi:uncharacterized protein EI90DRAFT_624488 [Cantharellus anzutake]|uniref:uncharacterized protein n=1 Tax=Cantharellus anzutake TaxID=1750568 RepID=UPI001903E437|nr:uncharacterized protein EI90DRAFT_624488 [Cantharellus anzutake]KAF8333086.1 hypothetical protein EI90DRAFT_624488 [Cantharellus anzutake]
MPNLSAIHFLGRVIVAAAFNSVLFGVITVQTATYVRRFKHDSWAYRFLVGISFLITFFQGTPFGWLVSRHFCIRCQCSNSALASRRGFFAPVLSVAFIPVLLHSYFVRLIHLVGQKRVLTIFIFIPVIAEFGFGVKLVQNLFRRPPDVLGQLGTGVRPYWELAPEDGSLVSLASGAAFTGIITSLTSCAPLASSITDRLDLLNTIGNMIGSIYAVALIINVHLRSRLRATSDAAVVCPRNLKSISVMVTREVAQELRSEGKHERTLRIRMTQLDPEYPATDSLVYYRDNPAFEA